MGIFTIYFNLLEYREVCVEVFLHEFFNACFIFIFLIKKLIAGEGKDFKALALEVIVHFHHTLVVCGGEASLAGNIDDHNEFPIFESGEVDNISINAPHFEVEEIGWDFLGQYIRTGLHDGFGDQTTHQNIYK